MYATTLFARHERTTNKILEYVKQYCLRKPKLPRWYYSTNSKLREMLCKEFVATYIFRTQLFAPREVCWPPSPSTIVEQSRRHLRASIIKLFCTQGFGNNKADFWRRSEIGWVGKIQPFSTGLSTTFSYVIDI